MAEIAKAETDQPVPPRPYYFPDTKGFLAIAIVVIFAAALLILMFKQGPADTTIFAVLTTLLGVMAGTIKDVYGYFFGSSASSQTKDDTQNKIVEKLTSAPPNGPVAPVPSPPSPVAVPWWNRLSDAERAAIMAASAADPADARLTAIVTGPVTVSPMPDDMAYLVAKNLLTQARATTIAGEK